MAGRYSGIGQGVLRLASETPESFKRASLRKAYDRLTAFYPEETFYVTITANVILKSLDTSSFSVYFGQSYGNAKAVFLGQEHDDSTGKLTRLFEEFPVSAASDLEALPVHFTTEDFQTIYKRNFARSNVVVYRVVSLVYIFSLGLKRYTGDNQQSRRLLRLF